MADNPQTLALIIAAQTYAGDIVRQINRRSTALKVIPVTQGAGKNAAWAAEGDGQLAGEFADGADASNFGSDAQNDALLTWSLIRSNFRVTGLAMAVAGSTATPAGNRPLWVRNMINSSAKTASHINARIYAGSGAGSPKQMTGLAVAIGDDTNVYATIDPGVDTYWKPHVVDPGTPTAITFGQIREDVQEIYVQCGEYPDVALCHPKVFNQIVSLFDSSKQFTVNVVETARGAVKLTNSQAGVEVDGVVFLKDKDATVTGTQGSIYYLNTNYIELQTLPQPQAPTLMAVPGGDQMFTANDGFGPVPLMLHYEKLAKTGDSEKAQIKFYGELCVKKRNAFGTRKNVAIAS